MTDDRPSTTGGRETTPRVRNHISKIHFHDGHVFTVLHGPELGSGGHVHYVELDQFAGPNYLVTVHGPLNPAVNPEVAFVDTRLLLRRIEQDEIHPRRPMELSYSIVSALARLRIDLVAALAKESGRLEQQVTDENRNDDPEVLLEDLFQVGHQLLAICTMATHSAAAYGGMAKQVRSIPDQEKPLVGDLADRFGMVRSMADGQRQFLQGVIEFYQTRTSTHLTVAAEASPRPRYGKTVTCAGSRPGLRSSRFPLRSPAFSVRTLPTPGFAKTSGFIASAPLRRPPSWTPTAIEPTSEDAYQRVSIRRDTSTPFGYESKSQASISDARRFHMRGPEIAREIPRSRRSTAMCVSGCSLTYGSVLLFALRSAASRSRLSAGIVPRCGVLGRGFTAY